MTPDGLMVSLPELILTALSQPEPILMASSVDAPAVRLFILMPYWVPADWLLLPVMLMPDRTVPVVVLNPVLSI